MDFSDIFLRDGKIARPGRHNLRNFLAANLIYNYFLKAPMLGFFVTFVTKYDKFWYRKWIGREDIKREWGNVESESLSISSLSLQFFIPSPFPHSFSISSSLSHSLSPFSRIPYARMQQVVQPCSVLFHIVLFHILLCPLEMLSCGELLPPTVAWWIPGEPVCTVSCLLHLYHSISWHIIAYHGMS